MLCGFSVDSGLTFIGVGGMMRSMKHYLFLLAASLCLCATSPLAAQNNAPDAPDAAKDRHKPKTAEQIAANAMLRQMRMAQKKFENTVKAREKVKIKWESSFHKAMNTASKYELPMWILYTDPARNNDCAELERRILSSKEFKKATGVFIGYRSASPMPQYGLSGAKPVGALFSPGLKKLCTLSYDPNMSPDDYLEIIRCEGEKLLDEKRQEVESCLRDAEQDVKYADAEAEGN